MKEILFSNGGISAKVLADSSYRRGRIITLQLRYPRFIHSEFMTHRVFSRSASSSRAIPTNKVLSDLVDTLASPIYWGSNVSGMQAVSEISLADKSVAEVVWKQAAASALHHTEELKSLNVHKQIANRITEPFQFINVIVTATEWENFFELRTSSEAQPEIRELALTMMQAISASKTDQLSKGDWHLPFITKEEKNSYSNHLLLLSSAARCARISYNNHDGSDPSIEKDLILADKLLKSKHMSPFEHQATPIVGGTDPQDDLFHAWWEELGVTHEDCTGTLWSYNFKGWKQHRAIIET